MKKVFFIAALLLTSLLATAQVKISRDKLSSDIEIQFKRCVVSGEAGYIDLMVINHGKEFSVCSGIGAWGELQFLVYDDEGNVLNRDNDGIAGYEFAGEKVVRDQTCSFPFPSEIPLKYRLNLNNVSEFATEFTLVKIPFWEQYTHSWECGGILLRNVPITRRD